MNDESNTYAHEVAMKLFEEFMRIVQPPRVEPVMTLSEAAKHLRMKPCTLRKLVYTNRIGFVLDGKQYLFKVSDLNDYINAHYTPAGASNQ